MPTQRRQRKKAHKRASPISRPSKSKSPSPPLSASPEKGVILQIINAIFWDLNAVTSFGKIVRGNQPEEGDRVIFEEFFQNARYFIHKAVWDHVHQPFQGALSLRCANFIQQFGWKFFGICAHAEAFRWACEKETDTVWQALKGILTREARCLGVYARTHGLEWQMPFLSVTWESRTQLPELERALGPEIDLSRNHHNQIVLTESGGLRLARFRGKTQVNIDKSFFNSTNDSTPGLPLRPGRSLRITQDPSLRVPGQGSCWVCMDRNLCNCVVNSLVGDLVMLTEYPNKGVGVRALTNLKAGDILDEFLGEIIPLSDETYKSNIYDIDLVRHSPGSEPEHVGTISPAWHGNWVRFLNHSCESSTEFVAAQVGKRVTILVRAVRDISIFEEITVNYGEEYWRDRQCLCGSENCVSRKAQETQE